MTTHCAGCDAPIKQPLGAGHPRKWCSDECRRAATKQRPPAVPISADPVSPAVNHLLERLQFAPDDPRAVAGLLLRQLTAQLDATPGNVGLAREVRQLLAFLTSSAGAAPGSVDEEQVRFMRRRLAGRS